MGTTEQDLRRWLGLVVGIVALALVGAAAAAYKLARELRSDSQEVLYAHAEDLRNTEELVIAMFERAANMRGYLLSGDTSFLDRRAKARAEIERRLPQTHAAGRATAVRELDVLFDQLDVVSARAIEMYTSSPESARDHWERDAIPVQRQIEAKTTELGEAQRRLFEAARAQAAETSAESVRLLLVLLLAVALVVTILVFAYARATRSLLARQKAEQQQATFRLLEQVPVGIFVLTPDGKPYYANAHAQKILGRGVERVDTQDIAERYSAYQVGTDRIYPAERLPVARALIGEVSEVTDMEIRRSDEIIPIHIRAAPVTNARGDLIYAVAGFQDVRELQRIAMRDALTGLSNRAAFGSSYVRERIAARRRKSPLAIALIDLDRFKSINDTHGHASGDEVLRRTAEALQRTVRGTDIVGRWGGEEIVVLLPDTDREGARIALDKLLAAVRLLRFTGKDGETFGVTFSAGVVIVEPDEELDAAVARADKLLYAAKAAGRNRALIAEPSAA